MATERTGGCLCGAVRYRLASEPFDSGWCHCRLCQLASGSPGLVFATVPRADYVVDQGADYIDNYRSTSFGSRQFCTRCGTPLSMIVDHQPDVIDFTVATLDAPAASPPGFHIFHDEGIGWAELADTLPRFAGFRPKTPGLPSDAPP
jgi:hypothetical protein